MSQILDQILEDLLSEDAGPKPSDDVADIVLAACQGDDELREVIGGGTVARPDPSNQRKGDDEGAYIKAVTVAGFRGIGNERTLELQPGPGLTLVVGRNGSGKSSFAEAAELVLTGSSRRWEGKSKVWTESWRNLHKSDPCSVTVKLSEDGVPGLTTVGMDWSSDSALSQGRRSVQRQGAKKETGQSIDWSQGLSDYRPFLSYSDLGALVTGSPSALFDAMHSILGLHVIVDAQARLKLVEKEMSQLVANVKAGQSSLTRQAAAIVDDRATSAEKLLKRLLPDLDELSRLASGSPRQPDSRVARFQEVLRVQLPSPEQALRIADEMLQGDLQVERTQTVATQAAERLADILELAAAHISETYNHTCPVCDQTTLDSHWPESARIRAATLRTTAAEARQARKARERITNEADAFRMGVPKEWPGSAALTEHLREWHSNPDGATQLRNYAALHTYLVADQETSRLQLQDLEDQWKPFAISLAEWVSKAQEVRSLEPQLKNVKLALKWLKAETQNLRDERIRPYADASAKIWDLLRQESNIQLGPIRLVGSGTNRHVSLDVEVDGVEGVALGVMSQGELHALGLSLFIPRATSPESPFRFVMIDDPVQAMDPAKVDGLARVLADAGKTRQVVVFTHDNRLPEAVRRLQLPATILEVVRKAKSVVEIRTNSDPVSRYLDDARAVALTGDLPLSVRGPVVAGFCRSALESMCHQRIRRDMLNRGVPHDEVEESIEQIHTVNESMALALFGSIEEGKKVLPYLKGLRHSYADSYRLCKEGVHGGALDTIAEGRLRVLIEDTEAVTRVMAK